MKRCNTGHVPWRIRILIVTLGVIGSGVGLGLFLLMHDERSQDPILILKLEDQTEEQATPMPAGSHTSNVVPDDHRQMMDQTKVFTFRLISNRDTQISVSFTGAQVQQPSGWQTDSEHHRFEPWRLKAGILREVCVEQPATSKPWRAYVGYSKRMQGLSLLKANLHEVWKTRSFSNWNGKKWGGMRFEGSYEICSEAITAWELVE